MHIKCYPQEIISCILLSNKDKEIVSIWEMEQFVELMEFELEKTRYKHDYLVLPVYPNEFSLENDDYWKEEFRKEGEFYLAKETNKVKKYKLCLAYKAKLIDKLVRSGIESRVAYNMVVNAIEYQKQNRKI